MAGVGRFLNSLPGLIIILVLITFLGAFLFQKLESPNERYSRIHVSKTKQKIFILAQQLARKGPDADWSKLVSQVDRYREKLYEAWQSGTDELTVEQPTKWTIWGSIYYCFTLFTTIGYGDVFPATFSWKTPLPHLRTDCASPICSFYWSVEFRPD
ncbi:TWiK family of potassium channels protein 7 [Fasciola gigantica]|uniref:TWiK family of potassium channels protein 7 n=1 Tax=Fasciola gigantica TaxID=46835 RepID=A0A504Z0J3_FASGI|nr:TWiK family of potassium channels protein 7 [Fasciola gigantica]